MFEQGKTNVEAKLTVRRNGPLGLARRIHEEDGAAAIPFVLALPLLLMIVAVVVQYSMLVSAYTVVGGAAEAAGRSAMVNLPEGNPDAINRAAYMVLAETSPKSPGVDADGQAIEDAYQQVGMAVPGFGARYSYAKQAATVTIVADPANDQADGRDFTTMAGASTYVRVKYPFMLTVPGAATILSPKQSTVGGVQGRFTSLTQTVEIMTTPSRKATAGDVTGPPLQP